VAYLSDKLVLWSKNVFFSFRSMGGDSAPFSGR